MATATRTSTDAGQVLRLPAPRRPAPLLLGTADAAPRATHPAAVAGPAVPAPVARPRSARSWDDAARPRLAPDPGAGVLLPVAAPAPARRARLVDHLFTVLALLGLAVAGLTVYAAATGLRPLVVRSGSMEPTIGTGSMVLVRQVPAAQIAVGDVVAVDRPDGVRVTHRVLAAVPQGTAVQLRLKGDANPQPDPDPVVVASAGEVVWTAPLLGRLSAELASARGGFVLGCLVTAGVLAAVRGAGTRRP